MRLVKKSCKRKGSFDLLGQENSVSRRKYVSRWEPFRSIMRLVDIFQCAWVGESCISLYVHSTYTYIYTYIFVMYTKIYMAAARFIVLPINRHTIHIFESQSDLYRLSFVAYSLIALIVFRFVPSENVRSSFHRILLLYNVEVVAEIVFVVTSTYAVIMTNCVL